MDEERKKILIVEDEQSARRMLSFNLKLQGYDILEAEDGPQALNLALAEKPSLILLDIMMPGENGFEVCKKIRLIPEIANVPIIVLTARAGMADKNFAFKAGADDYLTKPVDLQSLNSRVEKILKDAEVYVEKPKLPDPGQVAAFFSPQRKQGVTTLAIKLASVLSRQAKHPVLLIDLALPIGDVAAYLSLDATKNCVELLSQPTASLTRELIESYMQPYPAGFQIIPAPVTAAVAAQRATSDNLLRVLSLLTEAGYTTILDLGSTLTELNLTAIRAADKVFTLTSGQPTANEALDNFLILSRKLGLDLGKLMPVINQVYGPVSSNIVLVRSPVARMPYFDAQSSEFTWANELALQKLSTVITT
jgi:DNA-binding response OmpR family regulator